MYIVYVKIFGRRPIHSLTQQRPDQTVEPKDLKFWRYITLMV